MSIKDYIKILVFFLFHFSIIAQDCFDSAYVEHPFVIESTCRRVYVSYPPVCGCDSITYNSLFCAEVNGILEYSEGPCTCIDSSTLDTNYTITKYFSPVGLTEFDAICGCNGERYFSIQQGIEKDGIQGWEMASHEKCNCVDSSIIDLSFDCYLYNAYYQVCGCDSITYKSACEAYYVGGNKSWTMGACTCEHPWLGDTSFVCEDLYDPVCACGVTYDNACIARNHFGVFHWDVGECPCLDTLQIINEVLCEDDFDPVCNMCDSISYFNECVAFYEYGVRLKNISPNPCRCKDDVFLDQTKECYSENDYNPVCGCDSVTYANECVAIYYGGVTKYSYGSCPTQCIDSFLINTNEYCSEIYDPVCGCDSITYNNECIARYRFGVKSWTIGSCELVSSNIEFNNDFTIFPTVTSDNLYINTIDNSNRDYTVIIYSLNGLQLIEKVVTNSNSISLSISNFSNGLYLMSVSSVNSFQIEKVLKL